MNKISGANNSNPHSNVSENRNNNRKTVTEPKKSQKLFTHPVTQVEKQTITQRNANMEPMQPIDHPQGTEDLKDRIRSQREPIKVTPKKLLKLQPKIYIKVPRVHAGATIDRPETTNLILPPIPEIVWQQPRESHLSNIHKTSNTETHKKPTCPNLDREMM